MKNNRAEINTIVRDCIESEDRDLVKQLEDEFTITIPKEEYSTWVIDEDPVLYILKLFNVT